MNSTDKAKALLASAEPAEPDFLFWYRIGREAIACAVGAVEALDHARTWTGLAPGRGPLNIEGDMRDLQDCETKLDKALADFEKLFPED